MKVFKKIFSKVFSLSAFKLGLVTTFGFTYLAYQYYGHDIDQRQYVPVLSFIEDVHQKTVDYRLKLRGIRESSDEIALAVVDDTSLEKIGRWPWPRKRIADMIDLLRSYGAKVIAFDAVFSEPEVNPAMRTLSSIKDSGLATPELIKVIDKEIEQSNSDLFLSKAVERHADNVVMGGYFDPPDYSWLDARTQFCVDQVDKKAPEYSVFEADANPIVVVDQSAVEVPKEVTDMLNDSLENIELVAKSDLKENASVVQKLEVSKKIKSDQYAFCATWLTPEDKSLSGDRVPASVATAVESLDAGMPWGFQGTGRWWLNVPVVNQVTKNFGSFNAHPDKDGTIRRAYLVYRNGDKFMPSIALKSIMMAKNYGALLTVGTDTLHYGKKVIKSLELTNAETGDVVYSIPVDYEGRLIVNYTGPQKMFSHLPIAELFNGKDTATIKHRERLPASQGGGWQEVDKVVNKAEWIKDKVFLFGATAIGIYDLRVTPFEENFPGPEIHTNLMENILNRNFLQTSPLEENYMIVGMIGGGLALTGVVASIGAVMGLLVTIMALAVILFVDKTYLFSNGTVATIVLPIMLVGSLYIILTFYKYLTEERKKKELKGTFAKFVSPQVVEEILKDPENVELGGKKMRMSVMFSDVRGFTTISEKLEPTKLGDILNMYLTPMTRLVFETKGTLDKYMGDAIMAFWGAPISFADHAKHAAKCALMMMKQLAVLNKQFNEMGLPNIDIGIGINTGDMSVGNMGSDIVRSYTVMGDSVNLGSRLEGINKEYGTHIIVSEYTHEEIKNDFLCREIDWVRVKGKNQPVRIFELICEASEKTDSLSKKLEHFSKGFDLYHERKFSEALSEFNRSLEVDPEDYASKLYVKRCTTYQENPPSPDWDGVYEMKTK